MPSRAQVRRRRAVAVAVTVGVVLATGVLVAGGADRDEPAGTATESGPATQERPRRQLPGGGERLFPDRRIVAFYGSPLDRQLGELGIGSPISAARRLIRQAEPYDRETRPVLPALELISTIATADPGQDGLYRMQLPDRDIRRYLRAARATGALLLLDIQPGRAPFGPEVERLAKWLREPDVGLALDPEWAVGPDGVPGQVIGGMDAEAVNATAAFLAKLVEEERLPEKLLIVHRFTDEMILRDERLRAFPGVQTVVNIDGFGGQEVKIAKYEELARRTPMVRRGFKLFYEEDTDVLEPRQVMALSPRPDVVVYE